MPKLAERCHGVIPENLVPPLETNNQCEGSRSNPDHPPVSHGKVDLHAPGPCSSGSLCTQCNCRISTLPRARRRSPGCVIFVFSSLGEGMCRWARMSSDHATLAPFWKRAPVAMEQTWLTTRTAARIHMVSPRWAISSSLYSLQCFLSIATMPNRTRNIPK
jgi:hypothetical protein